MAMKRILRMLMVMTMKMMITVDAGASVGKR